MLDRPLEPGRRNGAVSTRRRQINWHWTGATGSSPTIGELLKMKYTINDGQDDTDQPVEGATGPPEVGSTYHCTILRCTFCIRSSIRSNASRRIAALDYYITVSFYEILHYIVSSRNPTATNRTNLRGSVAESLLKIIYFNYKKNQKWKLWT